MADVVATNMTILVVGGGTKVSLNATFSKTSAAPGQFSVEVYQVQINKKYSAKFNIPVLYYSQRMVVAYGATAKEAGLDGNIVRATKLEEIAAKK